MKDIFVCNSFCVVVVAVRFVSCVVGVACVVRFVACVVGVACVIRLMKMAFSFLSVFLLILVFITGNGTFIKKLFYYSKN